MLRLIGGILLGYLVIAASVLALNSVARGFFGATPNTSMILNLVTALPFATLGGWLAAFIARRHERGAGIGLGLVVAVMSVLSHLLDRGEQSIWYWAALLALLVAGASLGSYARMRQANKLVT
jgi:hypothetical protein